MNNDFIYFKQIIFYIKMQNTYFGILPEELIETICSKLIDYSSISSFIKTFSLSENKYFRLACIKICPYLKKFSEHINFRSRIIMWRNIFEELLNEINDDFEDTECVSLYGIEKSRKEILIIQLYDFFITKEDETSMKICKQLYNKLDGGAYSGSIEFIVKYKYLDIIKDIRFKTEQYKESQILKYNLKLYGANKNLYVDANNFLIKFDNDFNATCIGVPMDDIILSPSRMSSEQINEAKNKNYIIDESW